MNINAKQMTSIDVTRMDITTVLGYFGQIKDIVTQDAQVVTALDTVWTAFMAAYATFDDAYAQARKWLQTEEVDELDKARDGALRGFLNTGKAMLSSPNVTKQTAAKYLMFIRDKYSLSASDEYMKETTAISQMIQEMEGDAQAVAALTTTGLDEWLADLKAKNAAFLTKMNERTAEQAGQQKGIVRDSRLAAEAAYRNVVKLLNAMAICEVPAGVDYAPAIDHLNAEVEHYRQILARKGVSTGSNSGGGSNSGSGDTPTPDNPDTPDTPDTPTPDPSEGGGGTGTITPGGGSSSGGDDNGGGSSSGGDDNGGGGGSTGPDED